MKPNLLEDFLSWAKIVKESNKIFCTGCGSEILKDAKFCVNCGKQVQ